MQVDRFLARYAPLERWTPAYGDFVINCRFRPWGVFIGDGLYSTRYGVIDTTDGAKVGIIFEGLPYLLFTMDEGRHDVNRVEVPIGKIKASSKGSWAILRHDVQHNAAVWYI